MRHISVLLGLSLAWGAGCDGAPGSADPASDTTGAARPDSTTAAAGPSTAGPTTTGGDGCSEESEEAPEGSSSGAGEGGSTSVGSSTGDGGTTSTGTDDDSSSGSETGEASVQGACDFDECVADCGYLIPDSDEGYGSCWAMMAEYEPWACNTEVVCPTINVFGLIGNEAAMASACLLDALATNTVGRVDYSYDVNEWDNRWGSIFIVGDGTVLIDLTVGGHCGNGGSYGWHPYRTRAMAIDHDSEALTGCSSSADPEEVVACAFGLDFASSTDSLPWLSGECVDSEPACP